MLRAFGPLLVVGEEFGPLDGVDSAAIYGSWAARYEGETGPAPNDIDVLILGQPDRDEVYEAASRAEHRLGLPVNTTIRRTEDWATAADPFSRQLKASPLVPQPARVRRTDGTLGNRRRHHPGHARPPRAPDRRRRLRRRQGAPGQRRQHVDSAALCLASAPEAAFVLAYDAARKSAAALLAHQGLRPTTRGGHIAAVEAMRAQFPGVPGLKSLDRLRRRRNQAEYPDPTTYDPTTEDEADDAIHAARAAIDSARTLTERPELGLFR